MKDFLVLLLEFLGSWGSKLRKFTFKYKDLEIGYFSKPPDKSETKPASKDAYMLIFLAMIIIIIRYFI